MKIQNYGSPEVSLSWILEKDSYASDRRKITVDTAEGQKQLIDTILLLISQDMEIRIGTDGYCLLLEANPVLEDSDSSYQWVDDEHFIDEYVDGNYPDYYPERTEKVINELEDAGVEIPEEIKNIILNKQED